MDVSKIKLFDKELNIKDETARGAIKVRGKVLILGDSFSDDTIGPTTPWYNKVVDEFSITDYDVYHNNGGGFVEPGNSTGYNFENWFVNTVLPATSGKVYDTVIIQCGVNDTGVSSIDTEYNAAVSCINKIKVTYPNANIIGFTCISYKILSQAVQFGINKAFALCGVPNTQNGMTWAISREDWFQSDELHPNQAGQNAIGAMFCAWLRGCEEFFFNRWSLSSSDGYLLLSIKGGNLTIIGQGNSQSDASSKVVALGSIPKQLCQTYFLSFPIYAQGSTSAFLGIGSDGAVSLISTVSVSGGKFGKWYVNYTFPLVGT